MRQRTDPATAARPGIAKRLVAAALPVALSAMLAGTAAANRVVEPIEGAYELRLQDVVLPAGAAGYVVFRPCMECDRTSMTVSSATVYQLDGRPASFTEFYETADLLRGDAETARRVAVYVYYDLQSNRVTRLALDRMTG